MKSINILIGTITLITTAAGLGFSLYLYIKLELRLRKEYRRRIKVLRYTSDKGEVIRKKAYVSRGDESQAQIKKLRRKGFTIISPH